MEAITVGRMKLALFIRFGLTLVPHQGFGKYGSGDTMCALGTAAAGLRGHQLDEDFSVFKSVVALRDAVLPSEGWPGHVDCPIACCERFLPWFDLVAHLNDDHRWTREQIADWLDGNKDADDEPDDTQAIPDRLPDSITKPELVPA